MTATTDLLDLPREAVATERDRAMTDYAGHADTDDRLLMRVVVCERLLVRLSQRGR